MDAVIAHLNRAPSENQRRFLQLICSNSHFCLAFGRETDRINKFFDFTSFKHVKPPLNRISAGVNGVATELVYDHNGYKASAILKTAKTEHSDNLFAEAYNGMKFVNAFNRIYPCFLETYGAFQYKQTPESDAIKGDLIEKKQNNISAQQLHNALEYLPTNYISPARVTHKYAKQTAGGGANKLIDDIRISCAYAQNNAILIQYIHRPILLGEWVPKITNPYSFCIELAQILFQVYSALAQLNTMKLFTHYDLHSYNVLLYEIPNGKHIEMVYKGGPDGIPLKFKSRYIAKIIDYGRSYFPDNANIYKLVCMNEADCKSSTIVNNAGVSSRLCGYKKGYTFYNANNNGYIYKLATNRSHDLRLAKTLFSSHAHKGTTPLSSVMFSMLQNIYKNYNGKYGVAEKQITTKFNDFALNGDEFTNNHNISTVQEFYWALYQYLKHPEILKENTVHLSNLHSHLYGTLTVDLSLSPQPMSFIIGANNIQRHPSSKRPSTKRPSTKRPTSKRPTTKRPSTKRPTSKRPTSKRPTSKRPTSKRPTLTANKMMETPLHLRRNRIHTSDIMTE